MTTTVLGKVMLLPRGDYSPSATYNFLDLVTYEGSSFVALKTVTGVTPVDDGVNYQLSASIGDVTPEAQAAAAAALASQDAAAESASAAAASAASIYGDLASTATGEGAALVGFLQAGTGSGARTVQDKAREIVSVKDFKCSDGQLVQGDGVHDDTTGIQAGINYLSSVGGGVLKFPLGAYVAKGLTHYSHVYIDLRGAEIISPDGLTPSVITANVASTTGTMSAGSAVFTVVDASNIELGCVVAIRCAGGMSALQSTTLTGSIDAVQTTGITLASLSGFLTSGILLVGSELITFTGVSGTTLTGVTRGVYGSTASTHTSGDIIGIPLELIGEVIGISGTSITIHTPALMSVTSAPVSIGSIDLKMYGGKIDGRRVIGGSGSNVYAVDWPLVRFSEVKDTDIYRADSAVHLFRGARDNVIDNVGAHDCSIPEASAGACFWGFGQCVRNRWRGLRIDGDVWVGVYLDNRTDHATEYDGACDWNAIDISYVNATPHTPWITNIAVDIVGGNNNSARVGSISGIRTPFLLDCHDQVNNTTGTYPTCTGNQIGPAAAGPVYQAWVITADVNGNVLRNITWTSCTVSPPDAGTGNLSFYCSPPATGGPVTGIISFGDGSQSVPSIAMASIPNTGFSKAGTGDWLWSSSGALTLRLRPTGLYFYQGMGIDFAGNGGTIGAGTSSMFAFWGQTPVVQPSAIADATDAASAITQLNAVLSTLRTIGLIGT